MAHLVVQLSDIPSQKSPEHGFVSMVQYVEVYTINGVEPWVDHIDPGPTCRGTDGTLKPIQQAGVDVV